jgi:hypothetical protein
MSKENSSSSFNWYFIEIPKKSFSSCEKSTSLSFNAICGRFIKIIKINSCCPDRIGTNFYNKGQQHGTYFKTRQNLGFKDDVVTVKTDTVVTLIPQGFAQLATVLQRKY